MTKDRLYTMQEDSLGRRSAQSAMYRILEALVRWLAPVLSFTAEEVWQHMPGERGESVLFETWYEGLAAEQGSARDRAFWNDLLAIRETASRVLEGMRKAGDIGASLQAGVTVYLDGDLLERYADMAGELRFFFITSDVQLASLDTRSEGAEKVTLASGDAWVEAAASSDAKCVRCWHHRPDVGSHAEHPELCGRCVQNVDGGGEERRWF